MLLLTLSSLGVIESPMGPRVPIITQTFDRIRLCFRMKVRFSDAFLASRAHRINQRQECKNIHVIALDTCDVVFKVLTSASRV